MIIPCNVNNYDIPFPRLRISFVCVRGRGRGGEVFAATKDQNDVCRNKESQLCDSHIEKQTRQINYWFDHNWFRSKIKCTWFYYLIMRWFNIVKLTLWNQLLIWCVLLWYVSDDDMIIHKRSSYGRKFIVFKVLGICPRLRVEHLSCDTLLSNHSSSNFIITMALQF